jgi:hypothetical protein
VWRYVVVWAVRLFRPRRKLSKHDDNQRRHTTSRKLLLASYQVHDLVTRVLSALRAQDVGSLSEEEFLANVNQDIPSGPAARIADDGTLDTRDKRVFVHGAKLQAEFPDWPRKSRSSLRRKTDDAIGVAARVMGYGRHRVRRLYYSFPRLKLAAGLLASTEVKRLFVKAARQAFNRSDLGRLRLSRLKADRRVAQSVRAYIRSRMLSGSSA